MKENKRRGAAFSPFLEIGAEYGIRSLVLTNDFSAQGFSLDIAHAPLAAMPFFSKQLGLPKLPQRICADAESLPFANNSFQFVFCYQTLHHFPNPLVAVRELYRVLTPGGYFFLAEEPIRQTVNFNFFRRPTKTLGLAKLLKIIPILPFISTIGKTEIEHGILEATYPLSTWFSLLDLFDELPHVTVESLKGKKSFRYTPRAYPPLSKFLKLQLFLVGGGIKVLARKRPEKNSKPPQVKLRCPDCKKILGSLSVKPLRCTTCQTRYTYTNGILHLLPKHLEKTLYA